MSQFFFHEIVNIFLFINFNMCFGCSKEPSHRHGSFEYPQHMFWLRNKKNNDFEVNQNLDHKIVIIFLSVNCNICFGYSKEPSQ